MANCLSGVFVICIYGFLLFPGQSLEDLCKNWLWVSTTLHLTWELGWLLFMNEIHEGRENILYYSWWAYIDGGDFRYATKDPPLISMEILSVLNGCFGLVGLIRNKMDSINDGLFFGMAVVHLYSASLYFLSEVVAGFPNVNTKSSFDVWVKFVGANSPWLIFPWFVIFWLGSSKQTWVKSKQT
mmetsp:Transcript_20691/g.28575  ORF Transcript_20691/g.28575 Transcript_20691/m.28575 type:complete len:184 (-) Transcript_20691:124-675(-)